MRSIWNGAISFGLVNIPVKLYSAIQSKSSKIRLLHKEKLSPIKYKKWCDSCEEEVEWNDIVRGYEVGKQQYVVLDKKELASIKPERNQSIEIIEVIDSQQVDPIYFDKHYYLGPERTGEKTYFLFKSVLQETAKMAIGKFVLREKEYLVAISPYKEGLLLTTINYAYEIRNVNEIEELKEKPKITKQEKELALELINKISKKEFKIDDFKDTYEEELKKLLLKKQKGEVITVEKEKIMETKEENLIEALKASLK